MFAARRSLIASARVVIGALVCMALSQTPAVAAPPLKWGADAEGGAPYIFKDPQDPAKNVGFEVDLAEALARQLGREIEFVQYDYVSLLSGLNRGDFDLAMNGLEFTPERAAKFRLSRPYYVYKLQLVARKDDQRLRSLEDCKAAGAVVGTLGETAAERLLDRLGIAKQVYDGQVEPYADLELGRIDAVLLDLPIAVYYARPNPKLKFVGEPVAEGYYAIAMRKDDETLAAEVDEAIAKLAGQGELQRIYEKWGIWNDDQTKLRTDSTDASTALFDVPPRDVAAEAREHWRPAEYARLLGKAAGMTVLITVVSMALAVVLGLVIAALRLYAPAPFRWAAIVYIEFFRGIPVLLLLFFIYYGLPEVAAYYQWPVSLKWPALTVAFVGFGLNYAAYEAEIYRAGIEAVPRGQWEAAASLGMTPAQCFRHVVMPQAIRTILPPMTNDFVSLFKDTSLVSVIAVVELTKQYLMLAKSSMMYVELGAITALLYLSMSLPLGHLSRYLERRWGRGH